MDAARFEFTDAAGRRRVVDITESPFRIGRSHTNQLALPSAEVSREHAEITWDGERFVARDCASRAGTFVNDQPIGEQPIVGGDRVRIGPHLEMTFATGERVLTREHSSTTSSSAITDLRQTALLLEGLRALGTAKVLDHLLEMVIDSAVGISGAERGFIMLNGPAGALEFKMARRRDGVAMTGTQFEVSRKIPDEVYTTGETRLIEDLLDGDVAGSHEGTIALGIRNVLCAPLRVVELVAANEVAREERPIGVLYLDSRERKSFKSSAIRSAVETLANEAANAIENARLYREAQEKVRLEHDLQTAKEFQRALLPRAAPGLGFFEAAAEMQPCRMIGGDFYEYVRLATTRLGSRSATSPARGRRPACWARASRRSFCRRGQSSSRRRARWPRSTRPCFASPWSHASSPWSTACSPRTADSGTATPATTRPSSSRGTASGDWRPAASSSGSSRRPCTKRRAYS